VNGVIPRVTTAQAMAIDLGWLDRGLAVCPEDTAEDRVHMLGVVAQIEEAFELGGA
jgi:hypothetical protein